MITEKRFVKHCAACHQDHDIEFTHVDPPESVNGELFDFVGECENSGVKVYMRHPPVAPVASRSYVVQE